MYKDKCDLSNDKAVLDYQAMLAVTQQAVASAHLLMEDYRHRTDAALEDLFQATYKQPVNATAVLHATIHAESNAESLVEMTKRYYDAIHLLHYLHGAISREEVVVVNSLCELPPACATCGDTITDKYALKDKRGAVVCCQGCLEDSNERD